MLWTVKDQGHNFGGHRTNKKKMKKKFHNWLFPYNETRAAATPPNFWNIIWYTYPSFTLKNQLGHESFWVIYQINLSRLELQKSTNYSL